MDDPTLSGWGDNTTGGQGGDSMGGVPGIMGIPGMGGYASAGRVPGGWGGGVGFGRPGGYSQSPAGLLSKVLPPGPSALRSQPQNPAVGQGAESTLSSALQALIAQNMRRMLVQGQQPPPQLASRQMQMGGLGQPQQVAPSPFGQPAQFGGQGPPGGGMRPLTANSPGP